MKIKLGPRTHLLIPDGQVKEDVPTEHIVATRNLICDLRPPVVVNIGDWWDMPSLSSYSSTLEAEGKRIKADFEAGNSAMAALLSKWPKGYRPEMHFTIGNHEGRIERYVASHPSLKGFMGYKNLNLGAWKVHPFLKPVTVDGVSYCHYFYNQMSGKPIGGSAANMLNKIGFSFVQGHRQELSYARKELANGKVIHGLVAGAFHMHDEDYKGHQAAGHWRGLILLHGVQGGEYDMEVISIERLLREYGE